MVAFLLLSIVMISHVHEGCALRVFALTKQIQKPIFFRNPYVAEGQKKYELNQKRPFHMLKAVKMFKHDLIKNVLLQHGDISADIFTAPPSGKSTANNSQKDNPSMEDGTINAASNQTQVTTEKNDEYDLYNTTELTATEFASTSAVKEVAKDDHTISKENKDERNSFTQFNDAIEKMEKDYYLTTFRVLMSSSTEKERKENGISFVVSSLWLHMLLLLLSSEVDADTRAQIDNATYFSKTNVEKDHVIKTLIESLPSSSDDLKLRWSNRLILDNGVKVSDDFISRGRDILGLKVDFVDGKNTTLLVKTLNKMVEADSGGALSSSFHDQDLSGGMSALLLNTIYLRSRWHGSVTLLNGTVDFRYTPNPPYRKTKMFRINDLMGYADLPEWDAEVLEIPYTTPYLSLVVVLPRSVTGIRSVAARTVEAGASWLISRLHKRRIAVSLPLFTLRTTVLLPNKLHKMGMPGLLVSEVPEDKGAEREGGAGAGLRLSHGMQKIMFWAKAGRYAFKDDGLEWDPHADLTLVLDRPYVFMVRWHDVGLLMGNFVL